MTTSSTPEAYIAVGKNRQKIYSGGKLFMQSGQEFSVELFNPTQDIIAAKIYLNDKAISDRVLVLKPGERAFLERYIDSASKLKFETYSVENSTVAKQAIANNGKVRVEFFREKRPQPQINVGNPIHIPYPVYVPTPYVPYNPYPFSPTIPTWPTWVCTTGSATTTTNNAAMGTTTTNSGTHTIAGSCNTASGSSSFIGASGNVGHAGTAGITGASCYSSIGAGYRSFTDMNFNSSVADSNSIETGMIGAGGYSSQSFDSYYGDFESYYFAMTEYQIMPDSQKPVEINQIRQYCPGCRTRIRKSSWKFCPSCGENLE